MAMPRAASWSSPDGDEASVSALAGCIIGDALRHLHDKMLAVYTSNDMKVGISIPELTAVCDVQIQPAAWKARET